MYNHVADQMVVARVTEVMNISIWINRSDYKCEESQPLVCKVTHQIIKPGMCIVEDQVGGNLCMKGNGHIVRRWISILVERGNVTQREVSKREKKSTLIEIGRAHV